MINNRLLEFYYNSVTQKIGRKADQPVNCPLVSIGLHEAQYP